MTEFNFVIDENTKILITVPGLPTKRNYYYKFAEKLNKFDEATAKFMKQNDEIILQKDVLQEIVCCLSFTLQAAAKERLPLPSDVVQGLAGRVLNDMLYGKRKEQIPSNFLALVNLQETSVLIYNGESGVCIEIAPLYRGNKHGAGYERLAFEQFFDDYQPLALEIISLSAAYEWHMQCVSILKMIDAEYLIR